MSGPAGGRELTPARRLAGACIVGLSCLTPSARAAEALAPPITRWDSPSECPSAETVLLRLSSVMGRAASELGQHGQVEGEIHRAGAAWVLSLTISARAAPGEPRAPSSRELRASDCDELADAAAVAIAIALGGEHTVGAAPAPAALASGHAAPAMSSTASRGIAVNGARGAVVPSDAMPDETTDKAPDEARETARMSLALSAEGVLDSASLGGAAFGPSLQARARFGALGIGVYALWLLPREKSVAAGQHVDFSLLAAGLRGCYRVRDQRLGLDVCAGFELGALSATSHELLGGTARQDMWLGPTWGAELGWGLMKGLRLQGRLEALLPLRQEEYVVNVDELVHRVPGASVRLSLGLSGAFSVF